MEGGTSGLIGVRRQSSFMPRLDGTPSICLKFKSTKIIAKRHRSSRTTAPGSTGVSMAYIGTRHRFKLAMVSEEEGTDTGR